MRTVFLIDASGSTGTCHKGNTTILQHLSEVAQGYVARLCPCTEYAIVLFGHKIEVVVPWTRNPEVPVDTFPRFGAGGTPLYEALDKAAELLWITRQEGRVVVLTDGMPDYRDGPYTVSPMILDLCIDVYDSGGTPLSEIIPYLEARLPDADVRPL